MTKRLNYIERAINVSRHSKKSMSHGACLVKGHQIVSIAFNDAKHAEINAIEKYLSSLKGKVS